MIAVDVRPTVVRTRRGPIEWADYGEGPAVLALHGAMGGYDQGLLLARTVIGYPGFRIVAVSRPGYLTTPLASGVSPEDQADLCAALLDALEITRAAVIAVSGGGQCALQFALRHPERCSALIMLSACSAPLTKRMPLRFHLMRLMARFPALVAAMRRRVARTVADSEAGALLRELRLSTLDRMAERLPGTINDITQSRLPFAYPLEAISAPVLVVHGTADEAVPFAQARALSAKLPNAELLAIEGGQHVSIFTHRSEVRTRSMQFLNTHMPST